MRSRLLANRPLISIGMSVRDGASTLGLSIQSIVNQSYENWELILIDDGSKDTTRAVATCFGDRRIRYFSDGHSMGLPVRLNQAIDAASAITSPGWTLTISLTLRGLSGSVSFCKLTPRSIWWVLGACF